MKLVKLNCLVIGYCLLFQGCFSTKSRLGPLNQSGDQDRYSVRTMTNALLEIENALGTEEIRAKREAYQADCRTDPKNPFKRFLWAFSLDDRNEAWTELSMVAKLQESFYWSYLGMAIILDSWNVYDQAQKNYRQALKLGPDIAIGYGRFGRMYLRMKNWQAALPLLDKAVQIDPERIVYRLDLARALSLAGRTQDVMSNYKKAIEMEPGCVVALSEYADLLLQRGEKEKALQMFQRAAQADPNSYQAQYKLATLFSDLGQKEQALAAFFKACERKPTEVECWLVTARLSGSLEKEREQVVAYERVLEVDPEHLESSRFLGPVYLKAGDLEKALPCYQSVLAGKKGDIEALSGLAVVYEQGGEFSRAIELNRRLLALSPDFPPAREALARLFEQFHILPEPITGSRPDDVFARNREQTAEVYRLLLREKPRLSGRIHLKVEVNNDGDVEKVSVVRNTIGDVIIDVCSVWNMRRSRFPKGFGATYNFELSLKPGS